MKTFVAIIKKYQFLKNLVQAITFLFWICSLLLLFFHFYFIIFSFNLFSNTELFIISGIIKLILLVIFIFLGRNIFRNLLTKYHAAKFLDKENLDTTDTYQNALELYRRKDVNPIILEKIIQIAENKANHQLLKISTKNLRYSGIIVLMLIITTFFVYWLIPSDFLSGIKSFMALKIPEKEHKLFVDVEPGDAQFKRNSNLIIKIIEPELDVQHSFHYKVESFWREETMINFERKFDNLDFSFDYYIKTPYAVSDTFRIEVFELPAVENLTLHYDYPSYTKLGSEIETNSTGFVKAIENTKITIDVQANNPLDECRIIFSNGETVDGERQGKNSFRFKISAKKSMNYHFHMIDFLKNKSEKIERTILVLEDEKPQIKIIHPGRDTLLTKNMILPLTIFASDDYGLENLVLHHFVNEQDEQSQEIVKKSAVTSFEKEHLFDLSNTFLLPGDRVTYWASVSDNSPSHQKAFTQRYIARFPSIEEIYQEVEKEENRKRETLQNTIERSKQMQEEFEQKRREMLKKNEYDWQDKQEIESFLKEQEQMNEDIKQMAQDYQKMIESLQQNQALSKETIEKMEKIRELMEEISNEQLEEAMKNLQKKMEKMTPEDIRKAMENMKFSLEEFQDKLEQTLKLLEDIKKEQALQKALEISKEMESMQEKMMEKMLDSEQEKLKNEQKQIMDKLDSLKEQIDKADSLLDEKKDAELKQKMQELKEQMEADSLQKDMQDSAESMEMKDMKQAMKSQQSAASKMKKMTKKMEEMMQMMSSGSMEEISEMIDRTILRLLLLSELQQRSKTSYTNDPFLIFYDQIANYDGVKIVLNDLYSIPMAVLAIGPKFIYDASTTMSAYQKMFAEINDAKSRPVPGYLEEIQKGINLMIFDLMQAKNNMQSGGGGSGGMQSLMQSLQQMGEQQLMLNMMTQEMMKQIGEEGSLSQEMRNQARKLAEQEERLAENLRRVLETDREAQNQTSAMNQIIEELEEIARQLKQNRIDQSLLDRQQRILSRLLDAQKSIHKREFSKKRKGESGEEKDWLLPEEIKLRFDKIRRDALLKQELEFYPKAFRDLIQEYFKKVNENAGENREVDK